MIGIDLAKSTVERYMFRRRDSPSPNWQAFLRNHVQDLVSIDFFVVPTIRNRILYVFLVLATDRRRVVHFNVTANPATSIPQAAPSRLLKQPTRTPVSSTYGGSLAS